MMIETRVLEYCFFSCPLFKADPGGFNPSVHISNPAPRSHMICVQPSLTRQTKQCRADVAVTRRER